ncbi:hypothetical protein EQ500_12510 [Lactobacillus sp. XV13L]|nr:hypothetical protein [Lactobacillus sp. XV13L]
MSNDEITADQARINEMWLGDDYYETTVDDKWLIFYDSQAEPAPADSYDYDYEDDYDDYDY